MGQRARAVFSRRHRLTNCVGRSVRLFRFPEHEVGTFFFKQKNKHQLMDLLHCNKTRCRQARRHATRRQIKTHQTYLRCKISNRSLTLHMLFHVNWFPRFTPAWRVLFARDIRFTRILLHRQTFSKSTLWVFTKLDLVSGMHACRLAGVPLGNSNNSNFPERAHAGRSLKGAGGRRT